MYEARDKQDEKQKTITTCGGVLFFQNVWVDVPAGSESEARTTPALEVRKALPKVEKVIEKPIEKDEGKKDPEISEELEGAEVSYSASPTAQKLADDLEIDLALVEGTGAGGNIRKSDVQAYADSLYEKEI